MMSARTISHLVALAFCLGAPSAFSADLIVLRQSDELYLKDGTFLKGRVSQSDNTEELKVRDLLRNTTRMVKKSDISKWNKAASLEDEIARLSAEYAGRADRIYQLAEEIVRRFGKVEKAIALLRSVESSRDPAVLGLLGQLLLKTGDVQGAFSIGNALVSSHASNPNGFTIRGQASMELNKLADAEKDLDTAFKLAPDSVDVIVPRANYFLRIGRPDDARKMFAAVLDRNPNNVAALVGKGNVMLAIGELAEAETAYQLAASAENNRNLQALLGTASTRMLQGKLEASYKDAEQALRVDPRSGEAYAIQAFAKLMEGSQESIQQFYRRLEFALQEKPTQPRLQLAWAVALERDAKLDELSGVKEAVDTAKQKKAKADQKYQEVLALKEPDPFLQYWIGDRKFRSGDYRGAREAFDMVSKLAPRYAPGHAALGAAALKLSDWEGARTAYDKAIELDGGIAEHHAGRGLALLKLSRYEEAAEFFKKARSLDRKNVTALCGLGFIENYKANKSGALSFFSEALAVDGECAYAANALTRIYALESMLLDYVTASGNQVPIKWKGRPAGAIRASVTDEKIVFAGQQGSAAGGKCEFFRDIKADEFVKFEADLEINPASAVTCGLRISSTAMAAASFELEFGKDETNEIKVRYRDYGGAPPDWRPLKAQWPTTGKVRLGIESEDLSSGKIKMYIDGRMAGELKLNIQKPVRVSTSVFVQAPQKELVRASADNIVLVLRGKVGGVEAQGDALKVIENAPEPKEAPQQ